MGRERCEGLLSHGSACDDRERRAVKHATFVSRPEARCGSWHLSEWPVLAIYKQHRGYKGGGLHRSRGAFVGSIHWDARAHPIPQVAVSEQSTSRNQQSLLHSASRAPRTHAADARLQTRANKQKPAVSAAEGVA